MSFALLFSVESMHDVTRFGYARPVGSTRDWNLETGTLFVVATPIGNRDDLTPRARQVLSEVELIAAEDTRHTGRLLSHFGIGTPLLAFHEHNEERRTEDLVQRLVAGSNIALVSDAGTPLVSDPGYRLVSAAHAAGIGVSPIPGASAVISALSVAGLPTDRFTFEGFLPARAEARRALLRSLATEPRTIVFLESVHKIRASLPDVAEILGAYRPGFIGRELTKMHEQCVHASLGELASMLEDKRIPAKGEFVLVVGGADRQVRDSSGVSVEELLLELLPVLPGSEAVNIAARLTGARRNDVYRKMLALSGPEGGHKERDD
jgi:16S rRNA (cytidine1402-2'-O)-methyltransferase